VLFAKLLLIAIILGVVVCALVLRMKRWRAVRDRRRRLQGGAGAHGDEHRPSA